MVENISFLDNEHVGMRETLHQKKKVYYFYRVGGNKFKWGISSPNSLPSQEEYPWNSLFSHLLSPELTRIFVYTPHLLESVKLRSNFYKQLHISIQSCVILT